MPEQKDIASREYQLQKEEDFASLYANNVSYEMSVWDLKMIFGELNQNVIGGGQTGTVDYHTAITLPWPAVKLMVYYLRANLAAHEAESGPVKLPDRVLPPEPTPPPKEVEDNPQAKAAAEAMHRVWSEEFSPTLLPKLK